MRGAMHPEALRKSEVFSALSSEQLFKLAEVAQVTRHEPGETLTEEGAIGFRFYLILEGTATSSEEMKRSPPSGPVISSGRSRFSAEGGPPPPSDAKRPRVVSPFAARSSGGSSRPSPP